MAAEFTERLQNEGEKHFWRVINFTERSLLGPLTPQIRTPWRIAFMWERCTLYQYIPLRKTTGPPLLIIPPLMVRPTIFDLRAGHSFVSRLMEAGIDVYLLDMGIPDRTYREVGLDDYILEFVEPAFDKVIELSGFDRAFLFGWSMGGIMSYIFSSLMDDKSKMAGLITCGSPVDFSEMFPFHILAKIFRMPLTGFVSVIGNIPPSLIKLSFRMISPLATVMRYGELASNYHDREWVAGYESIDNWVNGFLPYAQETFRQFVQECVIEDKLRKGNLFIGERQVDLKNLNSPLLAVAGHTDKLAPVPSVEPITEFVGSDDINFLKVNGGHIGMIAGRRAPDTVWKPIAEWIRDHG